VLVHALFAAVRTRPEPTIFAVLDGLDKILAYFVRCSLGIAVFRIDNFLQLFLIPIVHGVLLFLVLLLLFTSVRVKRSLLRLSLHRQIV